MATPRRSNVSQKRPTVDPPGNEKETRNGGKSWWRKMTVREKPSTKKGDNAKPSGKKLDYSHSQANTKVDILKYSNGSVEVVSRKVSSSATAKKDRAKSTAANKESLPAVSRIIVATAVGGTRLYIYSLFTTNHNCAACRSRAQRERSNNASAVPSTLQHEAVKTYKTATETKDTGSDTVFLSDKEDGSAYNGGRRAFPDESLAEAAKKVRRKLLATKP